MPPLTLPGRLNTAAHRKPGLRQRAPHARARAREASVDLRGRRLAEELRHVHVGDVARAVRALLALLGRRRAGGRPRARPPRCPRAAAPAPAPPGLPAPSLHVSLGLGFHYRCRHHRRARKHDMPQHTHAARPAGRAGMHSPPTGGAVRSQLSPKICLELDTVSTDTFRGRDQRSQAREARCAHTHPVICLSTTVRGADRLVKLACPAGTE